MALVQKATPEFETIDENGDVIEDGLPAAEPVTRQLTADERVAMQLAKQPAAQPAAQPETKAVAVKAAGTTAVANIAKSNPYTPMKDALRVNYDTLPRLMATNGNFQNKETKKLLGDVVGFELISFQDSYVMSPGGDTDDEAAREFLRYSDDGKVSTDGQLMTDIMAAAKEAGYEKAAIKHRVILVGSLFNPGKLADMQDAIVQLDLAPNSVKSWTQLQIGVAFKVLKNLMPVEGTERLRLEIIVKDENKNQWSEVSFSLWK